MSNQDDPRREKLPKGEMTVRAILPGHYDGKYIRPGDVFTLEDAHQSFSFSWMEAVIEPARAGTVERPAEDAVILNSDGEQIVLSRAGAGLSSNTRRIR